MQNIRFITTWIQGGFKDSKCISGTSPNYKSDGSVFLETGSSFEALKSFDKEYNYDYTKDTATLLCCRQGEVRVLVVVPFFLKELAQVSSYQWGVADTLGIFLSILTHVAWGFGSAHYRELPGEFWSLINFTSIFINKIWVYDSYAKYPHAVYKS